MTHTLVTRHICQAFAVMFTVAMLGCATPSARVEKYVVKHPERPQSIISSLREGEVQNGMLPDEVRLCLGKPNQVDRTGPGLKETWHYFKDSNDSRLKGSSMWILEIPSATVFFSEAGVVVDAQFYDTGPVVEPEATRVPPRTATSAERLHNAPTRTLPPPVVERPVRRAPAPEPRTNPDDYTPSPDELGVTGWPRVTLGGVSVMADDRSAVLNGAVYEPGEIMGEVTLIQVFANGVLIEYRGQRTFLRPGSSTQ